MPFSKTKPTAVGSSSSLSQVTSRPVHERGQLAQPFVTPAQELCGGEGLQLPQGFGEDRAQQGGSALGVAVGAARRLRNNLVYNPEAAKVLRRQLQEARRFLLVVPVAPQNGGAALRTDHRVDGVLQHQDSIAHRDGRSEERRVGKECRSRWSQDH